ncbi:hypothetical protein [Microlunatus ginsengisoli]|uniref:Uncharacterized protein n=1 Tax=Microlunatus ginsengisoli TaxID=363863 RepID=A0ABP7ACL2_9ACTN
MCRPITCKTCGKTTWTGCGQHVDAVMRDVSPADRCRCERGTTRSGGFLAGLFGR